MQLSRTAPIALVTLILLSGCASLRDVVSTIFPQEQNVNLSLMPGTRAPQPSWIDGDLRSGGESERPPEPGTKRAGLTSRDTEAVVWLPAERRITQIVVHSDEIMSLDLYFETALNGWTFNSRYAGLIGPTIVLDPKGLVSASGVKLRITEGTKDRAQRDEVITIYGSYTEVSGETDVRVEIKEIEILGPGSRQAAETGATDSTEEASSTPEGVLPDGSLN